MSPVILFMYLHTLIYSLYNLSIVLTFLLYLFVQLFGFGQYLRLSVHYRLCLSKYVLMLVKAWGMGMWDGYRLHLCLCYVKNFLKNYIKLQFQFQDYYTDFRDLSLKSSKGEVTMI